jgi:hypothetical protein
MNAVVVPLTPPAMQSPTPLQMLADANARGADLATLKELMAMAKEWKADLAREAFVAAMAQFKANPPTIVKDKQVSFTTTKGTTSYTHATLGKLCAAIVKSLALVGISHRWEVAQANGLIKVTCQLTHAQGHSESVSLHSGSETSGTKNDIQAMGSAITYLERYTLLAATGLAAEDQDDDGKGTGQSDRITESQAADIEALITEVKANKAAFLKYLKCSNLSDIRASSFKAAVAALEAKRRA